MTTIEAIDQLQKLHCESVIYPEDYEAIQIVVEQVLRQRNRYTVDPRPLSHYSDENAKP